MTSIENVKNQAKGFISGQIDQRTTDLGNLVGDHVQNLRSMGESLRSQGQTPTASLVEVAANRLDDVSSYLRNTDGDRMMHDLESIARSQPLVTAGVGLLTGLLAARVLKASASQRYQNYVEDSATRSPSYGTSPYGTSSSYDTTPMYDTAGMQSTYGTDAV